ncbi:ABC transporter substrate-binding protein [Algicella marina]|uniref:ABC transporter substrate-binding protein n=2 Tax=Algicella marina TaxID=2683284 RepID=A0A6P1T664_9RHOB|nr:ABC transporter substrate-binding protein [Algicella marina]
MYGTPELPPGFVSLPYANPKAPKGGRMVVGEVGGFDSMNPYILKGEAPYNIRSHVVETLLGRSWDESFTLYGLLAESVETGPNREWVEFHLRPEAKFSDGSPVTIEDVIWSFETLAEKGHPRYRSSWEKIDRYERVGERGIRFDFNTVDNELPLILGLRPILRKADWDGRDFAESSLDRITGSGPYIVGEFEPNRYVEFVRNPDYWGSSVPYNQGLNNIDTIRYEYFTDANVVFEAFKAGELSYFREGNPAKWKTDYSFPAALNGDVVKEEIPHRRPAGMEGFVFNTRREIFSDWRVREALIQAFNFEFINQTMNDSVYPRRTSYYANSDLAMSHDAAEGAVKSLLEPFADTLVPGTMEGYSLPVADIAGRNRSGLREARRLLQEAGWRVDDAGVLRNGSGQAFEFTVLLRSDRNEAIANMYAEMLARLGITMRQELVDSAQHNTRKSDYDYDMMVNVWGLSLSPGNEQYLYWGRDGVNTPGTRNYMGMDSVAAEAMIDTMLTAESQKEFVAAVKALDRILMAGRYVVPFWFSDVSLVAHTAEMKHPEALPIYGDWIGFLPEVWWIEE